MRRIRLVKRVTVGSRWLNAGERFEMIGIHSRHHCVKRRDWKEFVLGCDTVKIFTLTTFHYLLYNSTGHVKIIERYLKMEVCTFMCYNI